MCSVLLHFWHYAYSPYTRREIFLTNITKNYICKLFTLRQYFQFYFFEMTLSCPKALLKVRISFWVFFILSAYSENMRNVLNRIGIRGKSLYAYVYGEDAKIYNAEDTSVNNGPTWNFLDPYFLYKIGWIKLKNISRYCPFKKIPAKLARCSPSYDTTPM